MPRAGPRHHVHQAGRGGLHVPAWPLSGARARGCSPGRRGEFRGAPCGTSGCRRGERDAGEARGRRREFGGAAPGTPISRLGGGAHRRCTPLLPPVRRGFPRPCARLRVSGRPCCELRGRAQGSPPRAPPFPRPCAQIDKTGPPHPMLDFGERVLTSDTPSTHCHLSKPRSLCSRAWEGWEGTGCGGRPP